jgi:hypothetical protein
LGKSSRTVRSGKSKGSKKSRKMKMSPVSKRGLKINRPGANPNASRSRRSTSQHSRHSRNSSTPVTFNKVQVLNVKTHNNEELVLYPVQFNQKGKVMDIDEEIRLA